MNWQQRSNRDLFISVCWAVVYGLALFAVSELALPR